MLKDLLLKNRSYRRFDESFIIDNPTLTELIDYTRLCPSARNAQAIKYITVSGKQACGSVFPCLGWAAYLKDWPGPSEGERPSAYIVMLHDTSITNNIFSDDGIAALSILLAATERGLGGCIIASVQRDKLAPILGIDEKYKIIQVLALGKPIEKVVLEPMHPESDYKYWRDEHQVHHVPKRSTNELIICCL